MAVVVALSGYSRCGKNFTADILKKRLEEKGLRVTELAFADKLKELVSKFLNIDIEKLNKLKNENSLMPYGEEMLTVRDILKRFSEIIKEDVDVSYFANIVKNKIKYSNSHVYIITDLRFGIEDTVLNLIANENLVIKTFVKSNLSSCTKYPADVEVDDIEFDHIVTNTENELPDVTTLKELIMKQINKDI